MEILFPVATVIGVILAFASAVLTAYQYWRAKSGDRTRPGIR
jgi:hypothetical protein